MRTHYRAIAHVVKTHGKQGEVVVGYFHGLPTLLEPGQRVALLPPELEFSRFATVESIVSTRAGDLVAFEEFRSISEAASLVGKTILVNADDLPENWEMHNFDALIDARVSDAALGHLGTIVEVMHGPTQDVWVLRCEDLTEELMIPVLPEMVVDVDSDEHEVQVALPMNLADSLCATYGLEQDM